MDGKSTSKSSKTKIKRNRRSLNKSKSSVNKNNVNNENKNLSVMGVNSNGLISKKESMLHLINELNPSILTVQETFARKKGLLKIQGYEIFERVRENKSGGGLFTAVDSSLDPVLVSVGENESEILTVQINIKSNNVRIINAYGPQEQSDNYNDKILTLELS